MLKPVPATDTGRSSVVDVPVLATELHQATTATPPHAPITCIEERATRTEPTLDVRASVLGSNHPPAPVIPLPVPTTHMPGLATSR